MAAGLQGVGKAGLRDREVLVRQEGEIHRFRRAMYEWSDSVVRAGAIFTPCSSIFADLYIWIVERSRATTLASTMQDRWRLSTIRGARWRSALLVVALAGSCDRAARAQSAALHPVSGPASSVDVVLGDASGRFAAPGYFRSAPAPFDFAYYAAREGRPDPSGIVVDEFRVVPRLTVDEAVNSNVFAKSNHAKT